MAFMILNENVYARRKTALSMIIILSYLLGFTSAQLFGKYSSYLYNFKRVFALIN